MKFLKTVGIAVAVIVVVIAALLFWRASRPAAPENYTETVKTGGPIEAKYLAMGQYDVSYTEQNTLQNFKKYEIYYPTELAAENKMYPVVIFSNGTGVKASKYPSVLRHLSSWGFIVIATEEEYSWNGFSSEMCLRHLILLNENEKIDGSMIKTAVALSPSSISLAEGLEWHYELSDIRIPMLVISSTGQADEGLVINLDNLNEIYDKLPDNIEKLVARRGDADHGDMLYFADGYTTAWFMWRLQGDEEAAKAFTDESPELMANELYQNQRSNIAVN